MTYEILDASALLAFLLEESGHEQVNLQDAYMSTINLAEVAARLLKLNHQVDQLADELSILGLKILPFSAEDAVASAILFPLTRRLGLSLGDRACLATAKRMNAVAVTADKHWQTLGLGISLRLIR